MTSPGRALNRWIEFRTATAGRDDLALVDERVGDGHGLVQQATGVVAQIEDDAGQLVADLVRHVLELVAHLSRGLLVEGGQSDIGHVTFDMGTDRRDLDHGPIHGDVERLIAALAEQAQVDLAVDRPTHLLDGLAERQSHHRLAVDVGHEVAGLDPCLRGGRVVDRRDDLDQAVLHRDLDAESAELALGLDLHVPIFFGVQIARMRVERGEHAVDGRLYQLLVADLLDIFGANPLVDVAE